MAYTVPGSFEFFRKNYVDLDSDETKTARTSRDFLISQLSALGRSVAGFPMLTGDPLLFGSFARKTKIRPLDDIDFMIVLNGAGMEQYKPTTTDDPYEYWLKIADTTKPLAAFPDDFGYVNSTKILNKIRDSLPTISQYSKAEIKKTHQAVTVNLKSYNWVFDVVPALAVGTNGITHYLIPDGRSNWIRTDPRKDAKRMTEANALHGGNLLPIMRFLKYWNNRTNNKPRLPSYYFENLVLNTFQSVYSFSSYQEGLKYFFDFGPTYLSQTCPDPKGLGPNLDINVSADAKEKVRAALRDTATKAGYAVMYEQQSDMKTAIYWWQQVFGSAFPDYG